MIKVPAKHLAFFLCLAVVLSLTSLAACERPASQSNWSPITDSYQTVTAEALATLGTSLPTSERTTQPQTTIAPTSTSQPVEISVPLELGEVTQSITVMDDDGRTPVRIPAADAYRGELEAFAGLVSAVKRDRELPVAAQAALDDMVGNARVIDALFQSARTGAAVSP